MNKEITEDNTVSAAERLGRALLESLGLPEGVTEDEAADAVISEWESMKTRGRKPARDPFAGVVRPPVPMRANSAPASGMDYADMSAKQFGELKRLLKKAASDGRKIKL